MNKAVDCATGTDLDLLIAKCKANGGGSFSMCSIPSCITL